MRVHFYTTRRGLQDGRTLGGSTKFIRHVSAPITEWRTLHVWAIGPVMFSVITGRKP